MPTDPSRHTAPAVLIAAVLLAGSAGTAHASGVAPGRATPVQREQAQSRFLRGRELYNAKKYDAALVELTASLDIVASPNTRFYVGRCLRDMGRLVAAYAELGRSAVEAKELQQEDARYEKAGAAALEERNKLTPKLAFVEIRVARAGEQTSLTVGGEEVRRGGWDEQVPVAPGDASIVVRTPGHAEVRKDIHLSAGQHTKITVDADAETPPTPLVAKGESAQRHDPERRSVMRPLAYATGGVAVAGLATFFAAGALANGTYSDLEKACGSGPCPAGHEGAVAAGRTQQTIANVGLVVFAAAGVASVTFFILGSPKKDAPVTTARVTAGPSFVGLTGGF